MSSADTSHFSESTRAKDRPKPVDEELAAFAVLADPSAIATATPVKTPGASEDGAIIERLRAELSRRAKQVETLSRDLSTTHSAPVVDAAPTSESSWKPVGTASEAPAAEIAVKPAAKSDETGLKRLLHAAHRARHDIAEQLSAREDELDVLQRENKELVSTLESSRAELENQAAERARVQELEGSLTTRASAYERVSDECNTLRRALVEAQREAAEARKASERNREVLTETRSRVMEREAEAGALRAALATNQKQTQARECDNEELQAALSIASETLEARRAELRQARAELETTTTRLQKSELHTAGLENELRAQNERTGQQTSELSQLKAAVPCLEKELEHSRSEFEVLRERLAERESELVDRRETLTRTQLECETLSDDLSTERQALARARERASQREATLASLRETLASIGKAASVAPLCRESTAIEIGPTPQPAEPVAAEPEADPQRTAQETQDENAREVEQIVAESLPSLEDLSEPEIADGPEVAFTPANVEADTGSGEAALLELIPRRAPFEAPGIFRMWRDGQIAKKLAPIGVATADEFFAGRIEPLFSAAPSGGLEILSLGGEDREFELRVARGLRKLGRDGFRIHFPVADPEHGDEIVRMGSQAGLDSELVPFRADAGASDLETLLFQAIIGDGALSRSDHLEPLVLALAEATRHGAMLAIAERTGRGGSRAAQEMGERIWRLMPERYKHNQLADRVETEYWRGEPGEGDEADLLALLRTHFAFEDFATFGHLVDRFVGPEIGPNFDPADDRDRRFIEQIANLDEAKLDAGALSPLHMVARLTARDPFVR